MKKNKRFLFFFIPVLAAAVFFTAVFFLKAGNEKEQQTSLTVSSFHKLADSAKKEAQQLQKEKANKELEKQRLAEEKARQEAAAAAEAAKLAAEKKQAEETKAAEKQEVYPATFTDYTENPDFFGWITVPGTPIDYPLVCNMTDNTYYLDHDVYGNQVQPGAIFIENYNHTDLSDSNTILYGHNQRDQSQFGSLHRFEDRGFFDSHPDITICLTNDQVLHYTIFSCSQISDRHILSEPDMNEDPAVFESYIHDILQGTQPKQYLREGVEVTGDDKIITLATCENGGLRDRRYVVQAVLTSIDTY